MIAAISASENDEKENFGQWKKKFFLMTDPSM